MKKKLLSVLLCLVMLFTVACNNGTKEETVTDREGNEVTIPTNIEKIVGFICMGIGVGTITRKLVR